MIALPNRRALLIALLVETAACSGAAPAENNNPAESTDFVRAKIDGVPWEVRGSGARFSTTLTTATKSWNVTGSKSVSDAVVLWMTGVTHTGTFPLGPVLDGGGFANVMTSAGQFGTWGPDPSGASRGSGTVAITELTAARVSGTFSFTAAIPASTSLGIRTVSEGAFSVAIKPAGAVQITP